MKRRTIKTWAVLTSTLVLAAGCQPSRPFYFFEKDGLGHYKDVATEIEYPDVDSHTLAEVEGAMPPLTVNNPDAFQPWELTLEEAVQIALKNGKVLRSIRGFVPRPEGSGGSFTALGDQLLGQPQFFPTVYNPALQHIGEETALSAFDAQFTSSMFWERNERPVNLAFPGFISRLLEQDRGTFQAGISKITATGGQATIRNNTSYEWNNNPSNLFASAWETNIEAEFRHPLLQGAGATFNRIAGPGATAGNNSGGVAIARIGTDIAVADLEANVRNLVNDVEVAYWELYYGYRYLDSVQAGRDAALATHSKIKALFDAGVEGGEAEKEAQAREQYYLFRSQVEKAQSNLFAVESILRYTMGLAATDKFLIRPADEPAAARVQFDWWETQCEGLVRRVELRQQKWRIKQTELQLVAAKNFLLPRLDAIGLYRWRGFGDDLIQADPTHAPLDNAFEHLTDGNFQEWQIGLQMTVPIGFRRELANVRSAKIALARDRAILQEQELAVSHELAGALRDVDLLYRTSETNYNRRVAAEQQVAAVQAAFDVGTVTLDLLLDAQRRRSDAESAYFRSLVDYMLAIANVHFRKGSLLEYNNVYLAEGPWPGKAYLDAHRHARQRSAGFPIDYGFTHPKVFSRGPFPQFGEAHHDEYDAAPVETIWEEVPSPRPRPTEELPLDTISARSDVHRRGDSTHGGQPSWRGFGASSAPWASLR